VGDLYRLDTAQGVERFRRARDQLFRSHPQSPIVAGERASFAGLHYFPYDPRFRIRSQLQPAPARQADSAGLIEIDTGGEDGVLRYRRAGRLEFQVEGVTCRLTVFSLIGYAGGLFLPFRDATSGKETYGGGRYLFDTAKNTDGLSLMIEAGSSVITIDFNYAYNPSCAYNPAFACPLAPRENWLEVAVPAGEMVYRPDLEKKS
jgi:uncharacterized protein (DUF1684 family)